MKRIFILHILFLWQVFVFGQDQTPGKPYYDQAIKYLQGVDKPYDQEQAKRMLWKSAATGNPNAMIRLGLYYGSPHSIEQKSDSAIRWFKAAAKAGAPNAYFLLGRLYQLGIDIKQDFTLAADYYRKGLAQNDNYSKNALAYLCFKGLGVTQDYGKAFMLFRETAESGLVNSMYFLGLCYRNGYGTEIEKSKADYWLRKAALEGQSAAMHELSEEPMPENISAVSPHLQNELKKLKTYTEKFRADDKNNYEGDYTGVAVYYDWSSRYVTNILPLQLQLKRTSDGYTGQWIEDNGRAAEISMRVFQNKFTFNPSAAYTRNNHYSARKDEEWLFNNANLNLSFGQDSTQLSGYVQFYSPFRKEPGKPLQIILKRKTDKSPDEDIKNLALELLPNPAISHAVLRFTLRHGTTVSIKIYAQNGVLVHAETPKTIPEGSYNFVLPVTGLAKGTYTVQLSAGNQFASKILIKQ